ncbi:MAG: MdtA/MuxA family multidrug efflux RND transporter periplasmic adaptor subunit [Bryobacteraceae bacterium]
MNETFVAPNEKSVASPNSPKKKRSWWPWVLLLLCAAAGATYMYPRVVTQAATPTPTKKGKGGDGSGGRAVPVVASKARKGDMPVYLTGLGSVTALNTVTVHTRVDGELMQVAFTEGQLVKKDDLLVQIDPRPFQVQLEQAEGQMARDQAMLDNAKLDLERYTVLLSQQAVPKQQYDTQVSTVNQFQATIKTDQAAIDNAKLQLVYSRITSPLTGRIGLRLVDQGNIVHAADPGGLAVITQLQPITVIFNISEDSLPPVTQKMRAGVTLPVLAYDRDLKQKLASGTLLTIDNQIDQTSGTVRFRAVFDNADLSLFPNQFVNARLLLDTKRGTVLIPTAAIQHSPTSAFVYVVKDDQSVEVRNITSTLTEGDESAVDEGLKPGDVVVIDGIDKLQQGTKVAVRMAEGTSKG